MLNVICREKDGKARALQIQHLSVARNTYQLQVSRKRGLCHRRLGKIASNVD